MMRQPTRIIILGLSSVLLLTGAPTYSLNMKAPTDAVHQLGMGVIRATFPSRGEVWNVSLKWSRDGRTFSSANIGLPRPWNLFRSVSYDEQETTVLIPVAAYLATSEHMLFFQEDGTYWFRVEVNFRDESKPRTAPHQRDKTIESVVVEQVIEVGTSIRPDLKFIDGLADRDLARAMFGEDFFERQVAEGRKYYADPEVRAVKVIGVLLSATRARTADSVKLPKGDVGKAADALLDLAKKIPESSYAPYAAYYAGCCYLAALGEGLEEMMKEEGIKDSTLTEDDLRRIASFVKKHPEYAKAEQALRLGIDHADAYLKPRAIYMQAGLPGLTGDWDEAERLLDQAVAEAPGEGTVQELANKARRAIAEAKKRQQRRRTHEDASAVP